MKKIFTISLLIISFYTQSIGQALQSPAEFLGYKIGSKFTRENSVTAYFKSVATAKKDMVKIESYGETNEGRELILAFIALPETLSRLEDIRKNNLRLTGLLKEGHAITQNAPAIVWLSYNIHGNEASSSEAAMLVLYELANPNNLQTKEWLKNTVIIIDPCMNPDGRDRYVNWYYTMMGKNYDADAQSREHVEPWPGGRTNHYNFDLNRDWAWQTQIETQQRMKKYNSWMPQVHVDFHEQGVSEPYYFAPAAEPFHEAITPWQRNFQTTIGKNNATYFDEKGWLYFTKERFDLFYPSYGDTYPIFNGAIGMTYEQGGGPAGGLVSINDSGDSLTLLDRITHHFTTSLSTIETASKNAQNLIDEFKKYFDDNRDAKNAIYQTYILTDKEVNKIQAVKALLDKNAIEYSNVSGKIKGYRYFSGKEEEAEIDSNSFAISMHQPKSSLVRVLFEPKSKLSDSSTYDITAWSIPYAYGVEAYALTEKKNLVAPNPKTSHPQQIRVNSSYGYLIPYTSFNSTKALAFLLKNHVKVRYAASPFSYNHKTYDRGTLIVLKTSNVNNNWNLWVTKAADLFNLQLEAVNSGFVEKGADFGSSEVHMITAPKVALLTGEEVSASNAGEIWNLFDNELDYPITLINASELSSISLKNYNILIMPNGNYRFSDKSINEKLKDFVRNGGKLIALEASVAAMANYDWGIKLKEEKKEEKKEDYWALKKYADREKEGLTNSIPGSIYKVELDNTHPLAYGYPNYYFTLKQDTNLYEFMNDGWNVGALKKENYTAGFTGYKVKNKLKDGLLFGVEEMGNGSIVFLADNPLFRLFWENGKMLFGNAIFLVGQ